MVFETKSGVVVIAILAGMFVLGLAVGNDSLKDLEAIESIKQEMLPRFSVEKDPSGMYIVTDLETGCQFIKLDDSRLVPRTYWPDLLQVCGDTDLESGVSHAE